MVARDVARWMALGALFLIPFTPLIVANGYFFPFITGKAFYFRVLVEIAVAVWVVLTLIDKEYRPRFSWIGAVMAGFVGWMFIADLLAPNALKAFWSNFERMEGWVLLIHLLGFFLSASAVLRVEKKWRAWFLVSLGVSFFVTLHTIAQLVPIIPACSIGGCGFIKAAIHQSSARVDASFGNAAYLAIYLLFNVFLALWLALTEKRAWLKWSLISLAVVEGLLIFFTETRGAIIGLVGALTLAALLTAVTSGKRARQWAIGALAVLLLCVGGFYAARDTNVVQQNRILQRVASISLEGGQTRFTIWGMALEGVDERPLVGWGQEGFNYVFNTHYKPSLYGQESWFDRAHNAFLDWLTAGGIPAFVLYLALFGSAIVLLWRSSELSRPEQIMLTAALAGYAFHNLFVFDNLYSYVYFFAILALVDSQVGRPTALEKLPEIDATDAATYALPIAAVGALVLIWTVNVTGMQTSTKLIQAMSPSSAGVKGNLEQFTELAANSGFAAQEVREQLVSFASAVVQGTAATDDEKKHAVTLAIMEMQKQVDAYPKDARERLQLAYAYRLGGNTDRAMQEVLAAAALSPNKQEMWIEAGATAWNAGNLKKAQEYFAKAYALGPQFPALATYAAAGHMAVGETAEANALLLKAHGTTTIDSDILAAAYYSGKNWSALIRLWKLRTEQPEATAQTWFSLAAVYYTAGDRVSAIATVRKAMTLFPEAAVSGAAAIKQLEGT